ncbi:MAG: polysaccharide biosynthesis C-terminal domain-containing protein, partial [Oscillospiraceae bacterium]|nr:polysaccharide biosynthesis C-terminal domain-containing protein [Oscillospiraceae bacterium]
MSLFRRKNVAMLEGPLIPKIFALAIPLMISNLLQMLYSAADMIVVARSGVSGAVGAIGSTTQVIQLVLVLSVGFAVGANVLVARAIGAKDEKKVSDAVHTALLTALLFGSVGGTIGFVFSEQFMIWMGAEGDLLKMAVKYCRIRFIGLPFLAMTNFLVAIFRAKGDGTTPLMSLALSGLVNVLLNLFFVLVLGMDVDGVAIATVLANVISSMLLLHFLRKE